MEKSIYLGGSSPFWATVDTDTRIVSVGGGYEPQWISPEGAARVDARNHASVEAIRARLQGRVNAGEFDLASPGEYAQVI